MSISRDNMSFKEWPANVPLPTPQEFELAENRHKEYMVGRTSDSAGSLGFMMATWTRECWWQFFFPEQDSGALRHFHKLVEAVVTKLNLD